MTDELKGILTTIDKYEQQSKYISEQLRQLYAVRSKLCTHEGMMESKSYYFSGSYYDQAYTEYWYKCSCCGFQTERKHERHSWYG